MPSLFVVRLRARCALVLMVLCCFGVSLPLLAQTEASYTGPLRVAGINGEASYAYRITGADTVRDGDFYLKAYNSEALLAGADQFVDVAGVFRDGRADGPWRFTFGDFAPAGVAEVADMRYHLAVDGERRRTEGRFAEGLPNGRWTASAERIANSRPVDTLLRSEVTFAAGVPQQTFRMLGSGAELLGRLTREGLAHDTWTLLARNGLREDWIFDQGRLMRIVTTRPDGQTDERPVLEAAAGATTMVPLDAAYLRYLELEGQLAGRGASLADSPTAAMLAANAELYAEVARVADALTAPPLNTSIRVVVPEYPLSSEEEQLLAGLSTSLRAFQRDAAALANDRSLRLVADTDEEAAFLRAALNRLRTDYLQPAVRVDSAFRQNILRSLPRDRYLALLVPAGTVGAELTVDYDGPSGAQRQVFAGPNAQDVNVASGGLAALPQLVAYAQRSLDDIRGRLAGKLTTNDRSLVLAAQGTRLERNFARIDSLVRATDRRTVRAYRLAEVRDAAERELADYRAADELARRQRLEGMAVCMDEFYALAVTLRNIPVRLARVEEAYTDEIWNNIIATVMEERIKKRITKAYAEVLIPYYLERAADPTLGCTEAGALVTELDDLHDRVLALRDADTDKLEDDLKGVDDPQRALALLRVKPLN